MERPAEARQTTRFWLARLLEQESLRRSMLLAITLLLPFGMGVRECEQLPPVEPVCTAADGGACVCEYEGKTHKVGDTFKDKDNCNDCACQTDGRVACTLKGCLKTCGGLQGLQCGKDEYCQYAPEAFCGAADQTGVCVARGGDACTEQYAPVCGCGDKTYGNACEAARAGVSVLHEGECEVAAVGCDYEGTHYDVGASFPASDGCNTCNCGENGAVGCTKIGCTPPGDSCGGLLGAQCAKGEYCDFYATGAQCGAGDQTGVCAKISEVCTKEYRPVCGCDDKTYGNACTAAAAGISVLHDGECGTGCDDNGKHYQPGEGFESSDGCNSCGCQTDGTVVCTLRACEPAPQACGGFPGTACPDNEYCLYDTQAYCGYADATGICTPKPEACDALYDPVCGCDRITYSNACDAAMKGHSVVYIGECQEGGCEQVGDGQHHAEGDKFPAPDGCNTCTCGKNGQVACTEKACPPSTGKACGGFAGSTCASNEFCAFELDAICGIADATGVCQPRPEACIALYDPVCGCDGKTYGNSCEAGSLGTGVRAKGECK